MKSIGNGFSKSKNRLFKEYTLSNPRRVEWKLVSWIDRHCIDCGKFIQKRNTGKRCHSCSIKYRNKKCKLWKLMKGKEGI